MVKRLAIAITLTALLGACATGPNESSVSASPTNPQTTASPLTLDEEIGAVMMVGFRGPLADQVLNDWRQRQFGGLLIVNLNQNATAAPDMSALIARIRGLLRHQLIAATDQGRALDRP